MNPARAPREARIRPASDEQDMPQLGRVVRKAVRRAGVEALRQRAESAISSGMTPAEFKAIREQLGMTQAALAKALQYAGAIRVSEFERATNPREIPLHLSWVMMALRDGWRPPDWPE